MIKHKQAYIALPEPQGKPLLVLQYNTLDTQPNLLMLHEMQQHFKKEYPSFIGSELNKDVAYLRLYHPFEGPLNKLGTEEKTKLNKLIQDFKYYVDDNEFNLTFDPTAAHLMPSYQAINVQQQLSPTIGFANSQSKQRSEELATSPNQDNPLFEQYQYLFQWEGQHQTIEDYITTKHQDLVNKYNSPNFLPVLLSETPDNYVLTVSELPESDTIFIMESLSDSLNEEISIQQNDDDSFSVSLPKSPDSLFHSYCLASTHKLKLSIQDKALQESFNTVINQQFYQVEPIEGKLFAKEKSNQPTID